MYIETCHFLRLQNQSPHALGLTKLAGISFCYIKSYSEIDIRVVFLCVELEKESFCVKNSIVHPEFPGICIHAASNRKVSQLVTSLKTLWKFLSVTEDSYCQTVQHIYKTRIQYYDNYCTS